MSRRLIILIMFSVFAFSFSFSSISFAHSGRTDSNGGHNCSQKSKDKGLCSGYHYHNGGSTTNSSSNQTSVDKDCSDFNSYDEVIAYWNAKGYSATYDPENLDGWGNNVVDDGIPCEPPAGYDLSKVNNSTYQREAIDKELGEKAGYDKGYTDGYQNDTKNSLSTGSSAYNMAYENSYNSGYLAGQNELKKQKQDAYNNGYSLGKSQGKLVVPTILISNSLLANSFEEGYKEGEEAYIDEQKNYYYSLGLTDGKNDNYNSPDILDQVFIDVYEEGYTEAQEALREEYINKGYEAAFSMIEYSQPEIDNVKLINWFKEGFESNKLVEEIQEKAFNLGKSGEDLIIPKEYKQGETIFTYYYEKGKEEYFSPVPFVATGVVGTGVTGYLILRRARKKQIKDFKKTA